MSSEDLPTARGQSLFKVLSSVSASMFGVQSSKRQEEDFAKGRAGQYILVGTVMTVVFVLGLYGLVQLVLGLATG